MVPSMHSQVPPFKGNFPEDIYVADLKPLGIGKIGEGLRQIQNYLDGFHNFAARAKKDGVTAAGDPANIAGHALDVAPSQGTSTKAIFIPPGLDYRNVDDPAEDKRRDRDKGAFIAGKIRYWLAPMPERGLYIYFHLIHPHPRDVTAAQIEGIVSGVDPAAGITPEGTLQGLRARLRKPDPGMPAGIDLQPKARHAARPAPGEPAGKQQEEEDTGAGIPVQRKQLSRPKTDWKRLGREWERDRDLWKAKKAKPFLKSASGEALALRNDVDDRLGYHRSKPPAERRKILKQVEQIGLWSGVAGGVIGRIRFALGDKFDDVAKFFEDIRARFKAAHAKAATAEAPGVLGGWKKRLFHLIAVAAKELLGRFVSGLFDKLGSCIGGMIMPLISEFTDDISEQLREKLEQVERYAGEQKQLLKREFEAHFGKVEEAIEALRTGQKVIGIISDAVWAIRAAVQLVSCVSPPGLGCLWGLLAQPGISAALDLIVGTQAFNDKVVNPALRKIFGNTMDTAQKKIVAALVPESLEPYAARSPSCGVSEPLETIHPVITGGAATEAELRKLRDKWEAENKDLLIRELQQGMRTGEGTPPTREEVLEAAEALKRSGLSAGELQKAAERTPRDGSGRPILDAFRMQVDQAVVEKSAPSGPGETGEAGESGPRMPSLSIRKRIEMPLGPRIGPTPAGPQLIIPFDQQRQIEIGPRILPPAVPGEEELAGPGATFRF